MTTHPRMMAARALVVGLGQVLTAPLLLTGVIVLTLASALPFGLVMGSRLQTALAEQPPVMLGSEEIDADWWLEFRRHAQGLDATFTPAIIGFAAPLDNLSAVLDGTPLPWAMVAPVAAAIVTWAFLWGGLIQRFSRSRTVGARAFVRAGFRHWPRCLAVSCAAAVSQLVLFLTIHAVLFGPVFTGLTAMVEQERDAFAIRVVLYLIFGSLLAAVMLVADYTRILVVLAHPTSLQEACAGAVRFTRQWWPKVATLFLLTAAMFGAVMIVYGIGEIYGGSRAAGWRGVIIGQAFIVIRLVFRLTFAASEVRLFEELRGDGPGLTGVDRA